VVPSKVVTGRSTFELLEDAGGDEGMSDKSKSACFLVGTGSYKALGHSQVYSIQSEDMLLFF